MSVDLEASFLRGVLLFSAANLLACSTNGSSVPDLDGGTQGSKDAKTPDGGRPGDGAGVDAGKDSTVVGPGDATGTGETSTPTDANPCAGLTLCEGFETDTAGGPPSSALWSIVTGCGAVDPASTVTIDDTVSYTGKNSVKVVGGDNTCGPVFSNTSAFKSIGTSVYGRFYARFSMPMQAEHTMFMGLGFDTDGGVPSQVNDNLEMTWQYGVYIWNFHDLTLPNTAPSASTAALTWACFEFHTDATTGDLDTWIGGTTTDTAVAPMTFDPGSTAVVNGVNSSWSSGTRPTPLQPTSLSFGWVTFGGSDGTVWFDDIAVGKSRIGCNP